MTKKKKISLDVGMGITEIKVSHLENELTFIHPPFGPSDYKGVEKQIESAGLRIPTPSEIISLINSAYLTIGNRHMDELMRIMDHKWFWIFANLQYSPNQGVKITRADGSTREVPFGYEVGEVSPKQLAKNPLIIGIYEESGSEKLARIAMKHRNKPYIWAFNDVDNKIERVASLNFSIYANRLCVKCDDADRLNKGYSLGVSN